MSVTRPLYFSLYNLQVEEWGGKVTIVPGDMRLWNAPEKVFNYQQVCHPAFILLSLL